MNLPQPCSWATGSTFSTAPVVSILNQQSSKPAEPPTSYRKDLLSPDAVQASAPRTSTPPVSLKYHWTIGSYASVYLALNANTGDVMAVKRVGTPQDQDTRQIAMVEALKLESETLRDLEHVNIVQFLGFEETREHLDITRFLEYVPGGSIMSILLKHGRFSEDVTKWFTQQILVGLDYIHSKGILHRDLKSDNILVDKTGVCKISDFGISKKDDGLGQHTQLAGTVYWMAPEVVQSSRRGYSSKVDIWSLACVVQEMWSGKRPWFGQELVAVMLKLHKDKLPPPVPADVHLTNLALDFRQKCFAMDPQARPSAQALSTHPYLELTPGWTFQLSDIEKLCPSGPLNLPSIDISALRPRTKRSTSPPPIVYIKPLQTPVRGSSRDSISPLTSESPGTASPRLRTKRSFYVVNPDPEPDDPRADRRPYVYNPPPLPREFDSRLSVAPTLVPAISMQDLAGHLRTSSARRSTYQTVDSYSSDSDTGYSLLWNKPPEEISARPKSIIETRQDVTWAPRPDLEEVYGRLEKFFPKVNLDTPSPTQNDRQRKAQSIRMVVENRDPRLRRAATTATKLWGHRVEEMIR
ncbi:kinase-like domain-containing protein [Roridomyces roridus]|uniref:Kinase-like domain-containing protein n=1 Tax=Roridomyces roridus TaxID=1738132 RepID=A0AAD7FLK7_9AGAR|nr:kinase-like domain-containing protein [Roridomyces roridus]